MLTVAAALVGLFAPVPDSVVERWYATGVYPLFQSLLTFASNAVPFAILDVLIAITAIGFIILTVRELRARRWPAALWRVARRLAVWSAVLYVAFLIVWGLNYRRVPLDHRFAFDRRAVTPDGAARLASTAVDRLNALHAPAHAAGFGPDHRIDPVLAGAFDRLARILSGGHRIVAGRPKRSMLDWYFQRAGVSGMTDPYFLETLVAGDLLAFERPFVVAHEWGHLAGLADEGEANLAGWLTCLSGSPAHQYSAWLFMYTEAAGATPPDTRARESARLLPGPRADLRAIRDRVARHVSPALSSAGWRVYDSYLKANRVEAGAMSYEDVVRLALGLEIARDALRQGTRRP